MTSQKKGIKTVYTNDWVLYPIFDFALSLILGQVQPSLGYSVLNCMALLFRSWNYTQDNKVRHKFKK